MVRVSLALGIIAAIAGLAAVGFGIPIQAFGLGNTLIISGSTVLSAGLIVITLSMVMRAIERLAEVLPQPVAAEQGDSAATSAATEWPPAPVAAPHEEPLPAEHSEARRAALPPRSSGWQEEGAEPPLRPAARPPGAPPPRLEREPKQAPPLDREASLRSRLAGRFGGAGRPERPPAEPATERPQQAPEMERRLEPPAPVGEHRDNGDHEPGRDPYAPPERRRVFGWTRRSKERSDEAEPNDGRQVEPGFGVPPSAAGRAAQGSGESREPRASARTAATTLREPRGPRERTAAPVPPAPSSPPPSPPAPQAAEQSPAEAAEPVEVLKKGTVDGMSYTLYTDGSIDAEFPEGRIRFNSIDELRQHLEA